MSSPLAQRIPSHVLFLCHYFSGSIIDIRRLKGFGTERLHSRSRVRNVLLSEREQLTVNDFLTKMGHLDNAIQPRDGKLVERMITRLMD
jgi:hypothetical protein